MTSIKLLNKACDAAKEVIAENFAYDSWRSTSLLIQVLCKQVSYYGNLAETNPDERLEEASTAFDAALALLNSSYEVPVSDERFELVEKMYDAVVTTFIRDLSDDAMADLVYLGGIATFIADMRVYAFDQWIQETAPTEEKMRGLKLAKRDAMAVTQAVSLAFDILIPSAE